MCVCSCGHLLQIYSIDGYCKRCMFDRKKIKKIEIKDIQGSELRLGAQGSEIFIPESYPAGRIQEFIGLTTPSSEPHLWAPSAISFFFLNSKNPDPRPIRTIDLLFVWLTCCPFHHTLNNRNFAEVWLKYPVEACVDDAVVLCCTVLAGSQLNVWEIALSITMCNLRA